MTDFTRDAKGPFVPPPPIEPGTSQPPSSWLRYGVRFFGVIWYPLMGVLLYDLFTQGLRIRSAYILVFCLFAEAAVLIGWKRSDRAVMLWFFLHACWIAGLTGVSWLWKPMNDKIAAYPWERFVYIGALVVIVLFALIHMKFRKRGTTLSLHKDESPFIDPSIKPTFLSSSPIKSQKKQKRVSSDGNSIPPV